MSMLPNDKSSSENQPAERRADSVSESNRSVEIASVARRTAWSAPLPHPSVLKQYDDAVPGAAERILRMTESQAEHRIRQAERRTQQEDARIQQEGDRIQQENARIRQEGDRIRQEGDRIQTERTVAIAGSRRGYLGIVCAFILSLLIISLGAYSVIWGDAWVGVAVIGINIAGLAGVFVYGTNARRRERERIAADAESQLDGGD